MKEDFEKEARTVSYTSNKQAGYRTGSKKDYWPYIVRRNFARLAQEEVIPGELEMPAIPFRKELNSDFFDKDEKLKKEIRHAMLKIAKSFYDYLKIDAKIKDIYFTGSLANYSWTSKSDVDLHIMLNLDEFEDKEFVLEYLVAKKSLWNDKHDITIKGFEVELFAKDEEGMFRSKGIYSLLKNEWIQEPDKEKIEIDDMTIKEKAAEIVNQIEELETISDDFERSKKADEIKKRIRKFRDAGLEKGGEYSIENVVFKVLRNNGYLEKLSDTEKKAVDKSLSVAEDKIIKENYQRKVATQENTLGVENGIEGMTDEKIEIIKKFINFTVNKLKMKNPVSIYLHKGRDEYITTTASYVPSEDSNHIRVEGRALVDILRSIGHELCHNAQREVGIFNVGDSVQNIGGFIEDQANSIAGILIKDFALNYGNDEIYDL